jgi:tRNA G37 N-methylase Trm5
MISLTLYFRFCSGNVTERIRAGTFNCQGQTVVDLYAGIGYYTLPFLVHGNASFVHACEWNANSVRALSYNLSVANISKDRYCIYENDNRISASLLLGCAHRVSLGLLPSSVEGWPLAVKVLRPEGGIIHVHENVHMNSIEQWVSDTCKHFEQLFENETISDRGRMYVKCLHVEKVKSYSPKVLHIVLDLMCYRNV